jgi:VWFA-related protein
MMTRFFFILTIFFGTGVVSERTVFSQKPDSNLVYFRVNVLDSKGETVKGLSKENFSVKEEKSEQEISYFSQQNEPASVVFLFDISSAISFDIRRMIAKSALKFVQISHEKNDYSLIAFGKDIYQLAEWGSTDAQILDSLNKVANLNLKEEKEKVLFKACNFALEKFRTSKYENKVLIIFSEFKSLEGAKAFKEVRETAKRNEATIYPLILPNKYDWVLPKNDQDSGLGPRFGPYHYDLGELAALTNGKGFYPTAETQYEGIVKKIDSLLKSQYVIGYKPNRKIEKESWQKVEIKFRQIPNSKEKIDVWSIRSRNGYYREK